jgi:integrase
MSVHQKEDKRWFCSYRDDFGKQHLKIFGRGIAAKKQAEAFDLQIKSDKKGGKEVRGPSGLYIDELAQKYINNCKINNKSEKYLKDLANLLNNHIVPLIDHKPVDKLDYSTDMVIVGLYFKYKKYIKDKSILYQICNGRIKEKEVDNMLIAAMKLESEKLKKNNKPNKLKYISDEVEKEYILRSSQSTINRYFEYLNSIFRYGIENDLINNNPLGKWKKTAEEPRLSLLSISDLQKLYDSAAPHLKWIIEVEWNIGTRPGESELLVLKYDHLDIDNKLINVYGRKTKKWRKVPINEGFIERLLEKKKESQTGYVIEYKGKPIRKIRSAFGTARKNSGITYDVRMYDIRHLFATIMLNGGADLAAVSKLLGHSSTQMTSDVYYHLMDGEKQRAINLLPQLNTSANK